MSYTNKNLTLNHLKCKNIRTNLLNGPTSARTVAVPIAGLRAPIPFFGFNLRGPILDPAIEIDTLQPVPEITIIPDPLFGDRIATTKPIDRIRLDYTITYTRNVFITNPLPAGPVLSYQQRDIFVFDTLAVIRSNLGQGIPDVNTWVARAGNEWADIYPGTETSFLTAEDFAPAGVGVEAGGSLLITFKY